jgi:lipopolysaccharide cholinephosphotransferase
MYKDELGFFKKAFRQTFKTRCYYIARCTIGFIFSFFKVKKLFKKYNEIPAQCKGKKYCTIVRGRNDYFGEMHPQEVFFPPQPAYFEGVKINIPNKADIYLTKLYGDYMQIPPPEKRERHFFTAFSLDTTKE